MYEMSENSLIFLLAVTLLGLAVATFMFRALKGKPILQYHCSGIVVTPCPEGGTILFYRSMSRQQVVEIGEHAEYIGVIEDPDNYKVPETYRGLKIVIYVEPTTGKHYWDIEEERLREFNLTRDMAVA